MMLFSSTQETMYVDSHRYPFPADSFDLLDALLIFANPPGASAVPLAAAWDLDSFSWLQRGSVQDVMGFLAKVSTMCFGTRTPVLLAHMPIYLRLWRKEHLQRSDSLFRKIATPLTFTRDRPRTGLAAFLCRIANIPSEWHSLCCKKHSTSSSSNVRGLFMSRK